jgi:hypothetical protein
MRRDMGVEVVERRFLMWKIVGERVRSARKARRRVSVVRDRPWMVLVSLFGVGWSSGCPDIRSDAGFGG